MNQTTILLALVIMMFLDVFLHSVFASDNLVNERPQKPISFVSVSPAEGEIGIGSFMKVIENYNSQDADEMECVIGDVIKVELIGDEGYWIKGIIQSSRREAAQGYFPKHIAELYNQYEETSLLSIPISIGSHFIAQFAFMPQNSNELELKIGDKILVSKIKVLQKNLKDRPEAGVMGRKRLMIVEKDGSPLTIHQIKGNVLKLKFPNMLATKMTLPLKLTL